MRDLAGHPELISINTATLGFQRPLEDVIDAVARAGFGALAPWRREIEGKDVAALARLIRDAGLKVSDYCRSTYFPATERTQFLAHVADNKRAITDAATLGAPVFVLVVGGLPANSKDMTTARGMVRDGIGMLMDHARSEGVKLGIEPLHPVYAADRSCITLVTEALDLCAVLEPGGSDVLGVVLDVYHIWWDPTLKASIAAAGAANRIVGFHVCDWLNPNADVLNDRGMMGDGIIDVRSIRAEVEATGYDSFVEVEIFSSNNWWTRPIADTLQVIAERITTSV
jgi:sugar phosphate isomerase/epimerase